MHLEQPDQCLGIVSRNHKHRLGVLGLLNVLAGVKLHPAVGVTEYINNFHASSVSGVGALLVGLGGTFLAIDLLHLVGVILGLDALHPPDHDDFIAVMEDDVGFVVLVDEDAVADFPSILAHGHVHDVEVLQLLLGVSHRHRWPHQHQQDREQGSFDHLAHLVKRVFHGKLLVENVEESPPHYVQGISGVWRIPPYRF